MKAFGVALINGLINVSAAGNKMNNRSFNKGSQLLTSIFTSGRKTKRKPMFMGYTEIMNQF